MSHLQDENPYIVHETTDLFESILKLFKHQEKHQESDPKKVLKMKVEKLTELEIDYEIWKMRRDWAKHKLSIVFSKSKKIIYSTLCLHREKKMKQLRLKVDKLKNEIEQLIKQQELVHNHMHGDPEIYTFLNKEQYTSDLQRLEDELQQLQKNIQEQKDQLKNRKKYNSDKKSYEKEIEKLTCDVERSQAKINLLRIQKVESSYLIRRRILWY